MNSRMFRILIPVLFFIISCTDENDLLTVTIGDNFITSQSSVVIIDTFEVELSNVLIDSIPTSGSEQLLIGKYKDNYLGTISSTSFFQLDIPESSDIEDEAVFDSLTLVLHYSKIWYGDTLQPQTFWVHRVLEDIEIDEDDSYLYNTSSFEYDETPLGSLTFYPRPNYRDTIEITLDNSLGIELMNLLKNDSDLVTNSDDFVEDYFKGLAIVPDENNTSVIGFSAVDSLLNMQLYTHYVGITRDEITYSFPLYSTSNSFNHIESDRTGTLVENLKTQREEIPSSETGDIAFLEAGLGIVTRIDIPNLGNLLEMDYRKILYKADLILKPYPQSYTYSELPTQLMLYNTARYNDLESEVTDSDGESMYATYYLDEVHNENTYYVFDVTDVITDELSDGYADEENGLIISLPSGDMKGTLDRVAFDAREALTYKPTLKLYYVFYN